MRIPPRPENMTSRLQAASKHQWLTLPRPLPRLLSTETGCCDVPFSTPEQLPTTEDEDAEASAIIPGNHPIEATHFWWYWDFAGAVFAVICMILIAVTLSKANGSPLVRPLEHLQLFDNASRGPWGSILMIRHLLVQSKLACALSLATILMLGISPSAQQILEYPTLYQELQHLDVAIGRADKYFSKGFRQLPFQTRQNRDPNEDLPAFQSKVLQALAGTSSQPQFLCPPAANRCSWGEFSTPAVCRAFRNVTEQTIRNCDDPGSPLHALVSSMLNTIFLPFKNQDGWIGQFIVLRHPGKKWEDKGEWFSPSNPTTPEVLDTDFRRCRKTYRGVNATNGVIEIRDENVAESFLQFHERIDTDKDNPYDVDVFETLDGGDRYEFTRTLASELPSYLENFKVVLMDQARSSDPGDDRNATTFMQGQQFGSMTFIRVRWAWFAVPVAAVVLGLGLFLTTVVLTRQTPLLKDSLLALLFYPLRDWEQDEIYVEGAQASEKPQKLAGSLHGRLETDEGRYRIVKQENVAKDEPKGDFSCGEQQGA
ncbi:hypothetical protein BDP55DRAFT_769520 [Colletotrichum godetiae]|uniref:Uncharacterized protein n=1 Tax=Colletotrichum godetiae TaxID=1209918 RepID=A0AAJ0AL75_9PEZI|nr:uncharacterized protein BDP55DRAFT_769520 [Colletotrichum godetiae]KAK1674458.1 hypothetical protein BDP55DRAFT_769520 [Colletotrichum godetiae]